MKVIKILAAITAAAALAVFFTSDAFAADRWSAAPRDYSGYGSNTQLQTLEDTGRQRYRPGNSWSSPARMSEPSRRSSRPQSLFCTDLLYGCD